MAEYTKTQLAGLSVQILQKANTVLRALGSKGTVEVHDKFVTDISTLGDRAVSLEVKTLLEAMKFPARFHDEELGTSDIVPDPKYVIAFDDIDGTNNYARGDGVLPYCTIVTIFDSMQPTYGDAIVASVINHPTGKTWIATRGEGTVANDAADRTNFNTVRTSGRKDLDKKTRILLDGYMGGTQIERFAELYKRGWVSDFCTSGVEFSLLASGAVDARVNSAQKAHELGAGYLLIKEAGGVVLGFDGKPIDDKPYDFSEKVPIVAAATPELAREILSHIKLG